jgi:hypothetical protein
LLAAEPVKQSQSATTTGGMRSSPMSRFEPFREVLAEASPIRVSHAAASALLGDSQSIRPHQSPFISIGALPDCVARRSLAWHTEG